MRGLFEAALRGDRAAQEKIAAVLRELARAVCSGGGPGGAGVDWEDVAQEASRKFFASGIHQFKQSGSERSYLYTIVRSAAITQVRREARRRVREEASVRERVAPPHNPGPRFDVAKILERVSEECRTVLTRVFLRGETYAALAAELEMLESSVRVKVSRCLRRARELAEDGGVA